MGLRQTVRRSHGHRRRSPPTEPPRTTVATVAHALSFAEDGSLGPLLLYKRRNQSQTLLAGRGALEDGSFVALRSLQPIRFSVLFAAVALLTCGWGLLALVPICFGFKTIACMRVNQDEWRGLPVMGAWAQHAHPRGAPVGDTGVSARPAQSGNGAAEPESEGLAT